MGVCGEEILKYLSVCSGIEAATVAWHPLGWKAFAYSEIEKSVNDFMKELRALGVDFEFRAVHKDGRVFESANYKHVDCSRAVIPSIGINFAKNKR